MHGIIPIEETVAKLFDWNRTAVGADAFGAIVRQFATDKEFFFEIDVSNHAIRAKCETVSKFLSVFVLISELSLNFSRLCTIF